MTERGQSCATLSSQDLEAEKVQPSEMKDVRWWGGQAGEKWGAGIRVTPASTEEKAQGLLDKVPAGEFRARAELLRPCPLT